MTSHAPLSAPAGLVLQDPKASGKEVVKVGLIELLAKGVLTLERTKRKGLLGLGREETRVRAGAGEDTARRHWPHLGALLDALAPALRTGERGVTMAELVKLARKAFGQGLERFNAKSVRPDLVARGLLAAERVRFLALIPYTRYRRTASGEALNGELQNQLRQARQLPDLLARDPASAAALALALGGSLLLVEELRPHLGALGDALRHHAVAGDTGGALESEGFELGFEFEGDAFDSLGDALDAFDAEFDDATSDSDGDGGDGGGD